MVRIYRIDSHKRKGFFSGMSLTTQLIFLNLIFYVIGIFLLFSYGEDFLLNNIALRPSLILSGKTLWTFVTSMFMHGSFFHIFANMFSLFFIGSFLEKLIGRKRFFWIYMVAGIIGGLFFIGASFLLNNLQTSAVGASGAIFGLLGVLAVLVPYSKVYLIVGPLLLILVEVIFSNILPVNIMSVLSLLINFLIILMIFSLFSFNPKLRRIAVPLELPMWLLPIIAIVPLTIIGYFFPLPIGNSAHIGGLVAGLVYGFILRRKFPNKTKKLRGLFK